jgi:predicted membrane chloride channel (bestrophin family)
VSRIASKAFEGFSATPIAIITLLSQATPIVSVLVVGTFMLEHDIC